MNLGGAVRRKGGFRVSKRNKFIFISNKKALRIQNRGGCLGTKKTVLRRGVYEVPHLTTEIVWRL